MNLDYIENQLSDRLKEAAGIAPKPVDEGLIDSVKNFFVGKQVNQAREEKTPLFDPYKDKQSFKILERYCAEISAKSGSIFQKIWAKYPESGKMFSMSPLDNLWRAELINIANGENNSISLVDYDIRLHPQTRKIGARSLFQEDWFANETGEIDGAMTDWIKSTPYGTLEYTGDWDDGSYILYLNIPNLRKYLQSKGVALQESMDILNENIFMSFINKIPTPDSGRVFVENTPKNKEIVKKYFTKVYKDIEFQLNMQAAINFKMFIQYCSITDKNTFLENSWKYSIGEIGYIPLIQINMNALNMLRLYNDDNRKAFQAGLTNIGIMNFFGNILNNKYGHIKLVGGNSLMSDNMYVYVPKIKTYESYLKSAGILLKESAYIEDCSDCADSVRGNQGKDDRVVISEKIEKKPGTEHENPYQGPVDPAQRADMTLTEGVWNDVKDFFGFNTPKRAAYGARVSYPIREEILNQYQNQLYPKMRDILDAYIMIKPVFILNTKDSEKNTDFRKGRTNNITLAVYNAALHPAISGTLGVLSRSTISNNTSQTLNNPMYVKGMQKFINRLKDEAKQLGIGKVGWESFSGMTGTLVLYIDQAEIDKRVNQYYGKVGQDSKSVDEQVRDILEPMDLTESQYKIEAAKIKTLLENLNQDTRDFIDQPLGEIELDGAKDYLLYSINNIFPRLEEYIKNLDTNMIHLDKDSAYKVIHSYTGDHNDLSIPIGTFDTRQEINGAGLVRGIGERIHTIVTQSGFGYINALRIGPEVTNGSIYFIPDYDKMMAHIQNYTSSHHSQDLNMDDLDQPEQDRIKNLNEAMDMVFGESVFFSKEDIFYHKDEFCSGEINILFIVGLAGSGKSSTAASMARGSDDIEHYDLKYIVNNNGRDMEFYDKKGDLAVEFFRGPGSKFYGEFNELKAKLNISEDKVADAITNAFVDFAIKYANSHKDRKFIIEGSQLHRYIDPSRFRDYAVCIKGTSIAKSMYQNSKKDGQSIGSTLAKTHQYAGDELKLIKYRNMYKRYSEKPVENDDDYEDHHSTNKPNTNNKKKQEVDWEFDEVANLGISDSAYVHLEAYQSYLNNINECQKKINQALQSMFNEGQILLEADTNEAAFKSKWDGFMGIIDKLIGRFTTVMDKIIGNNKGYLEKHKDIILNQKWGDQAYSYMGDYKLAQERINKSKIPEFNYATMKEPLSQDGYEASVRQFMSSQGIGTDFKYDPNEKNLSLQFKKYFLAIDKGESKGKLSDLPAQELYNFCYKYEDLKASVQRDKETLSRSANMIRQAIRSELVKSGENVQGGTESTGADTGNATAKAPAKNESAILEADAPTVNNTNNVNQSKPVNATPKTTLLTSGKTGPDSNKESDTKTNLKVENDKSKPNAKAPDELIDMIANKWIKICQSYYAGKLTAIQQISKDYMTIIKNHVSTVVNNAQNTQPQNAQTGTSTQPPQQ